MERIDLDKLEEIKFPLSSEICPKHKPLYLNYSEWQNEAEIRHRKGMKQKQCPICKRWLWKDEM